MRKVITFLTPVLILIMCAAIALLPHTGGNVVNAEEMEYDEVDVVSIAPPTVRVLSSTHNHYIFAVYFSKNITYVNYKHMAMAPQTAKDGIKRSSDDNPNMTVELVDFFDQSGLTDSINDCIYFNGNPIRIYQPKAVACMVHMGEENANSCMNIEFDSHYVPLSRNLDEPYVFEFKAGLKFPSGVMLKSDSEWKFMLGERTFQKVDKSVSADDVGFTVNYNGKNLTKTDNAFKIADKSSFNLDYLYVKPDNLNATIEIESILKESEHRYYVLITCTSENGLKKSDFFQAVIDYGGDDGEKGGCSSGITSGAALPLALAAIICLRRKKK
ncbi:MAG: hypothetical protein J5911_05740 [Clostridia bacterium]|nr:hypothetical protein [Clostridia bacterium]